MGCLAMVASADAIAGRDYFGTEEPFAAEAVYFVLTDRFVDGDPANNQVRAGRGEPDFRPAARRRQRRARQHRLSRRRFPGPARPRGLHPRHGFHGGLDHADRRQSGRGVYRRQPHRRGLFRGSRQDRLSRLLGRELLPRGRASRVARTCASRTFTRKDALRARPQDRPRHRLQPRLAVVHDAGGSAEIRRDLRRGDRSWRTTRTCDRSSSTRRTRCTAGFTASRTWRNSRISTTRIRK